MPWTVIQMKRVLAFHWLRLLQTVQIQIFMTQSITALYFALQLMEADHSGIQESDQDIVIVQMDCLKLNQPPIVHTHAQVIRHKYVEENLLQLENSDVVHLEPRLLFTSWLDTFLQHQSLLQMSVQLRHQAPAQRVKSLPLRNLALLLQILFQRRL